MTDKSQKTGKSLVLLFSKKNFYMYVSVKFYLYEILIHSVIHLLINIFLYQITILYPSGKRTQLVRNKLHNALCKATCVCKSENVEQAVISLLVKEKPREVVDAAAKVVSEEARELCKRNSNSILIKKDHEGLTSFTWDLNKELEIRAPNVLRIVSSMVSDITPKIGQKKYMNILHTVASGLHGHSTEMSGLYYIAFVLVHGGCTLRVFMSYALTIYCKN